MEYKLVEISVVFLKLCINSGVIILIFGVLFSSGRLISLLFFLVEFVYVFID